jgi:hypothetical protein
MDFFLVFVQWRTELDGLGGVGGGGARGAGGPRVGVWGGGGQPPPPPEITEFWQSWAEFPVPWKIHP